MTPVHPLAKARPDDVSPRKLGENSNKYPTECPFAKAHPDDASSRKPIENSTKPQAENDGDKAKFDSTDSSSISPKCPFGYDAQTFKIGPLSCVICQALLFESSKCVPCSHVYCKACISRFKDCPLCGADIEKIEADSNLQDVVDRFIEGHARIKRSQAASNKEEDEVAENNKVIYEDVSMERGAFLVQQAMRAFRAQNVVSAKSRLNLCAEDIRGQIDRMGYTSELCSQLGAVMGMLGDCCWEQKVLNLLSLDVAVSLAKVADVDRSIGNENVAVDGFEKAIKLLESLTLKPEEVGLEQRRVSVLEFLNKQLTEKQPESTPQKSCEIE